MAKQKDSKTTPGMTDEEEREKGEGKMDAIGRHFASACDSGFVSLVCETELVRRTWERL